MACLVSTSGAQENHFEVFPNPTDGHLQLRGITPEQVDIYNSHGQWLASYQNIGQLLDVRALPAGMYLLHLITENGTYVGRIVKQ